MSASTSECALTAPSPASMPTIDTIQGTEITRTARLAWAERTLQAAGIEGPRFEARLLLALALGVSRAVVVADAYPEPRQDQWQDFARLVHERARRRPLAYLRGSQEFYGLPFAVGPAVLIPRPETELLVDFAREKLRACPEKMPLLADVGTGSGCIAIATLAHSASTRALAVDISPEALALARRNAAANGVAGRLRLARASLLESVASASLDLIVSNPPYIPTAELPGLQPEVRDWEPRMALDGGADGLVFQRELATGAGRALRPGGWLAVEVAMGQAPTVADLLRTAGMAPVEIRRDLAGIERLVCGQRI